MSRRMIHYDSHSKPAFVRLSSGPVLPICGLPTSCGINNCISTRIASSITERTTRYKENEENETTKRRRGSQEKEDREEEEWRSEYAAWPLLREVRKREREDEMDAVEREWQNGASERKASHRHHGENQRRTKKAVGCFARVATLSCERREETGYMTMKREKRSTGRSVEWTRGDERGTSTEARIELDREGGERRVGTVGRRWRKTEKGWDRVREERGREREKEKNSRLGMLRGTVTETKRGESRWCSCAFARKAEGGTAEGTGPGHWATSRPSNPPHCPLPPPPLSLSSSTPLRPSSLPSGMLPPCEPRIALLATDHSRCVCAFRFSKQCQLTCTTALIMLPSLVTMLLLVNYILSALPCISETVTRDRRIFVDFLCDKCPYLSISYIRNDWYLILDIKYK